MATRDELYAKFGITAEAAQLFETSLGTVLLAATGLGKSWHTVPDPEAGRKVLQSIEKNTLGQLLRKVRSVVDIDDETIAILESALHTRNRLMHGFYERHNFHIQTDEGRDQMLADLEAMHDELFTAWRIVSALESVLLEHLVRLKLPADKSGDDPVTKIAFNVRKQSQ
ncbi:hypothetical protein [Parvibaculum sp.]|uniref:hypothetical protein n=1 Tax=Parvibaculum sp. TaxID=2024848 RepID=UPI003297F8C7